jgi:predicted transcriptional regulator
VPETEALYVRVRREVKERLQALAKERGLRLVDVASEALERGLGLQPTRGAPPSAGLAERLVGTWRMKVCRHLAGDGFCAAWELSPKDAERIYGGEARRLFEFRTVERQFWLASQRVEVCSLKPSPALCLQCPFFERR